MPLMRLMTPAERVILATLADVYEQLANQGRADDYGPYGEASRRLGVAASRVGEVEDATVGWPGIFSDYEAQARNIREALQANG